MMDGLAERQAPFLAVAHLLSAALEKIETTSTFDGDEND